MAEQAHDAIVIGSGPNGLAAGIALAREGLSVQVLEAEETVGGGTRSAELTLPGFIHDVCSAIHPLALASPFFGDIALEQHGLRLVHPPVPLAHPFDDGTVALLERSVEATAEGLGGDAPAYRRLMGPIARNADEIAHDILGPLRAPRHPLALAGFGLKGARSAAGLATALFEGERARGLLAGVAAHSMLPLRQRPSAGVGLMLAMLGHSVGWPMAQGGSQAIADALASCLHALGGQIVTGRRVSSLDELPPARAVLLDVTPRQVLALAGSRLPPGYRRVLERFRYGPGAFKLDWALDAKIPWKAERCGRAATVHLGGGLTDIAASEQTISQGGHPDRPYVILAQQSPFDATRAPEGKHTAWAYCHVPNGSAVDMTGRIEAQVERFAPGFRDRVLARSAMAPAELERYNSNYLGGDINGGLQNLRQLIARPAPRLSPYATPAEGLYICSSSTPPGGGVHGMCGYFAARSALRRTFRSG